MYKDSFLFRGDSLMSVTEIVVKVTLPQKMEESEKLG